VGVGVGVPAAQKGMEKAAPSKLPAARVETVHTPMPMFLQPRQPLHSGSDSTVLQVIALEDPASWGNL